MHILRPGGRAPIKARSLNLSPTGVFVEAKQDPSTPALDCPVGAELLCDIPLPGGRRYLRGKVARQQTMPSQAMGLGIRFENLEAADQAILHALVQNATDNSRLVKVRFEGMPEALRSRAVVTQDGLRLQTALPFLRLASTVDVSFIAGESRVETHGRLERVHLEPAPIDGIPRLAVDVALPEPFPEGEFGTEPAPGTTTFGPQSTAPEAPMGFDTEPTPVTAPGYVQSQLESPRGASAPSRSAARAAEPPPLPAREMPPTLVLHKTNPAVMPEPDAPNTPTPRVLKRRPPARIRERRTVPPAQVPVTSRLGDPRPSAASDTLEVAAVEPLGTRRSRPPVPPSPWWWVWGWPALGFILAGAIVYDRVMVARRIDASMAVHGQAIDDARKDLRETRDLARQAKGAAEATQVATLGLRSALRREVTAALETHDAIEGQARAGRTVASSPKALSLAGPRVSVHGNVATAAVPIEGSTAGMVQYSLRQPPGVVVKLPAARSPLASGRYGVRAGGFNVVWVQNRTDGLAVRFVYDGDKTRQEMLEVVEAGPDPEAAPAGLALGTVRVRLRRP
ncbi:MAG: PilZ domain-containing protein [Myxococcales bacterium]|nr:PilZ domain-containing protein [Myxococcales bacterium]